MEDRSIDRCRTKFRIRTEMMKTFKDNYRSKYRERGRGEEEEDPGLQCKDCSGPHSPDSQSWLGGHEDRTGPKGHWGLGHLLPAGSSRERRESKEEKEGLVRVWPSLDGAALHWFLSGETVWHWCLGVCYFIDYQNMLNIWYMI